MGFIFASWLSAPGQINEDDWSHFLNNYSVIFVVLLILSIVGIVAYYRFAALRLKIQTPSDVFRPYTPLYAIGIAGAGAVLAGAVAAQQFYSLLSTSDGLLQTACIMFLLAGTLSAAVGYLLIWLVPTFTPPKYRYRVAPFAHRK